MKQRDGSDEARPAEYDFGILGQSIDELYGPASQPNRTTETSGIQGDVMYMMTRPASITQDGGAVEVTDSVDNVVGTLSDSFPQDSQPT